MRKNEKRKDELVIYQNQSGAIEFRGDFQKETLWASQAQISKLFEIERSVVTKHIRNVFRDGELVKDSVCAKFAHTAPDGKNYEVEFYNLDLILSIGYRVNSRKATQFRIWATKTLRQHILAGYTINKKRIAKNYEVFLQAVEDVKKLLPAGNNLQASDALELVKMFASTWFSLQAYDKFGFPKKGSTKKQVKITALELAKALAHLKQDLINRHEASDLFGQEKSSQALTGIIGNVFQSFAGKNVYPSIEEKAAHLLYFIVKNHPFVDGNKRSGAFAFVWFLQKSKVLNLSSLSPVALTSLTLLVAESNPKDKERMIGLILLILK